MKKVSLKDIAREVGVSTALVSYVLNNLKEGRINKEIAARIREVAGKMNYRPNQIAKSLKTNRTYTIGVIVADIANPFSSSLARIIEDEANEHNYTVFFGSSDENLSKFIKLTDTFLVRQVDGLILSPPENAEKYVEILMKQNIPFVLLDRYIPELKTNYVLIDNHKASAEATKHLIGSGCTNVGMISYNSNLVHLKEREQGFIGALENAGYTAANFNIKHVDIVNNREEIQKAVQELLNQTDPVNGLLFASNMIAGYSLRYINTLSLRIPDHLKVVSFDETESLDLFYSPITYVRQPLQDMGKMAMKIILDLIGKPNTITQVAMNADLIIRQSTRLVSSSN